MIGFLVKPKTHSASRRSRPGMKPGGESSAYPQLGRGRVGSELLTKAGQSKSERVIGGTYAATATRQSRSAFTRAANSSERGRRLRTPYSVDK